MVARAHSAFWRPRLRSSNSRGINNPLRPRHVFPTISFFLALSGLVSAAQPVDEAALIHGVDAAVRARQDAIAAYTVTEHYSVFRNSDETHPAAEMTVKTSYRRETGKSYTILSQSGSEILRRLVLGAILEREKQINQPGVRESTFLTSANYEMKLKPGGLQLIDGRNCLALSINPRQKAPNMVVGTIWVDAYDQSLVQLQGTASKSVSHFAGPTEMMRQYAKIDGFAMATHARAASSSFLFGPTVVTIDYRDYQIQLREGR